MKKWLKEYLRFTRKERAGIFILLAIILAFLWMPHYYRVKRSPVLVDTALLKLFQSSEMINAKSVKVDTSSRILPTRYFYFDPNSISENEWQELGLRQKTIRTILNYTNKGGRFKTPADIRKIWGLEKTTADALIPYIRIHPKRNPKLYNGDTSRFNQPRFLTKTSFSPVDINAASVLDWEQLPGIGPILAARIIKFRDKLGGFSSVEQVKLTYGIKDSVFQVILPLLKLNTIATSEMTNKISINLATANAMKEKGIPSDIANAIVNYRKQYGLFKYLSDLKKIVFINETIYNQILPLLQL